jgi:MoxR-like ATPase
LEDDLLDTAMKVFYNLREVKGLKKKPSTSELIDWIRLLRFGQTNVQELEKADLVTQLPPYLGSLLKNEQDYTLMERMRRFGR